MPTEVPGRGCPPFEPSKRRPGAPIIQVTLSTAEPVSFNTQDSSWIKAQFTYEGVPAGLPLRPITIHASPLVSFGYSLSRQSPVDENVWEPINSEDYCGCPIYDDPDRIVRVGGHEEFVTLHPGESWDDGHWINVEDWVLPDDVKAGDLFRFQHRGIILDWWDWGTQEDHINTVVKLPCFRDGNVLDPKDNDGRPELLIPGSNVITFPFIG